jgi:hypothetical protein
MIVGTGLVPGSWRALQIAVGCCQPPATQLGLSVADHFCVFISSLLCLQSRFRFRLIGRLHF